MTNRAIVKTALAAVVIAGTGAVAVANRSNSRPAAVAPSVTATAPSPSPTPVAPRPGTFVAERGARVGVFSARTGGAVRWLTPAYDTIETLGPRLAADGRTVVYAVRRQCGGEVRTVDVRGGASRLLVSSATRTPLWPVLEPGGRRLAYTEATCGRDSRWTLVLRDLATGREQRLPELRPADWRHGRLLTVGFDAQGGHRLSVLDTTGARPRVAATVDPRGCGLGEGTFEPATGRVLFAASCRDGTTALYLVTASGTGAWTRYYDLDTTRDVLSAVTVDYDATGRYVLLEQNLYGGTETAVLGPDGYERLRSGVGSPSWQ
jgi:hypothetical protein